MSKTTEFKRCVFATTFTMIALVSIGCGKGFQSGQLAESSIEKTEVGVNVDDQLSKAEKASEAAQEAMNVAQAAVGKMVNKQGHIKLGMSGANAGKIKIDGAMIPIVDHLRPLLDEAFAKFVVVQEKYHEARLSLADAIGKLDANDPAQAKLIAKIEEQLAKLDQMEEKFRQGVQRLAQRLDLVEVALDRMVDSAKSLIPGYGWVIGMVLDGLVVSDIKALILEFQGKLLAL